MCGSSEVLDFIVLREDGGLELVTGASSTPICAKRKHTEIQTLASMK
jgi:hypothetical protein